MAGEEIPIAMHASAVPPDRSVRGYPEPFGPLGAGFKTGSDDPHHLINRTHRDVVYLAIDDRNAGDTVIYPHDDLGRALAPDCSRMFVHSDRRPY
jgi:hypothetical protein